MTGSVTPGGLLHIALHFLVPGMIAWGYARYLKADPDRAAGSKRGWRAYLLMISATLIDLDHLLADPIYDPGRCSIGFHPLHGAVPAVAYLAIGFIPALRWLSAGLIIHLLLDGIDCLV